MNRRVVLTVALLAPATALMGVSTAQTVPQVSHEEIEQQLSVAKARLKLTPEQEMRVRTLWQEESAKLRDIRTGGGTRGFKLRQARGVQKEFHSQLSGFLDAGQLAEWDRMRDEALARAKEKRRAH